MKNNNRKTLTIAAIIGAAVLIAGVFAVTTTLVVTFADSSETNIDGGLYPENAGSGWSTSTNDASLYIGSGPLG
jgi:hypothetical protein